MTSPAGAAAHDGGAGHAPAAPPRSPGFARIVWKRLRRDRYAMGGLFVIATLFVASWLAPVIANNKPIVMRWDERLRELMRFDVDRELLALREWPMDLDRVLLRLRLGRLRRRLDGGLCLLGTRGQHNGSENKRDLVHAPPVTLAH